MNIGYKPYNRRRITGSTILNRIRYNRLKVIGAGMWGVVLSDGTYAIKIGSINMNKVDKQNKAASLGFSIPVLYAEESITIDDRIIKVLEDQDIWSGGERMSLWHYIRKNNTADILIMPVAEPYISHTEEIDYDTKQAAWSLARDVAGKYQEATGDVWHDFGPYNMAIYRNAVIIIDF